jgi:hypothetical protein
MTPRRSGYRAIIIIEKREGDYHVRDLRSALGTIVNGEPIGGCFCTKDAPLRPGDNEVIAGGVDSPFVFSVFIGWKDPRRYLALIPTRTPSRTPGSPARARGRSPGGPVEPRDPRADERQSLPLRLLSQYRRRRRRSGGEALN